METNEGTRRCMQKVREAAIAQVPVNPRPSSVQQVFAQQSPNMRGGFMAVLPNCITATRLFPLVRNNCVIPLQALFSRSCTVKTQAAVSHKPFRELHVCGVCDNTVFSIRSDTKKYRILIEANFSILILVVLGM